MYYCMLQVIDAFVRSPRFPLLTAFDLTLVSVEAHKTNFRARLFWLDSLAKFTLQIISLYSAAVLAGLFKTLHPLFCFANFDFECSCDVTHFP